MFFFLLFSRIHMSKWWFPNAFNNFCLQIIFHTTLQSLPVVVIISLSSFPKSPVLVITTPRHPNISTSFFYAFTIDRYMWAQYSWNYGLSFCSVYSHIDLLPFISSSSFSISLMIIISSFYRMIPSSSFPLLRPTLH